MIPATPLKTKRQLQKGPAVYAIPISLDGRKSAYPGAAIGSVWCEIGTAHCRMTLIIVLILLSLYFQTQTQTKLIWIVGS